MRFSLLFTGAALLGAALSSGCAGNASNQACLAKPDQGRLAGKNDPGLMVSGSTPPGVYGVSEPGAYYSSVNSFPPGAAGVDGRCSMGVELSTTK